MAIWNEPIFTIPDIITRVINREYDFQINEDITKITGSMVIYPPRYFYPYHFYRGVQKRVYKR